jgi:hypothetical protein
MESRYPNSFFYFFIFHFLEYWRTVEIVETADNLIVSKSQEFDVLSIIS